MLRLTGGSLALLACLRLLTPGEAAHAATETVLHSFCNEHDRYHCAHGSEPVAGLTDVKGMLFGTTNMGGRSGFGTCYVSCGTVFALDRSTGKETLLYKFFPHNRNDGAGPQASLIDVNGKLYGTTLLGGSYEGTCGDYGCGTVFSFDPKTQKEKALYAFCTELNCTDGYAPEANLIDVNGILYGTASNEGRGGGVVFALNPNTRTEKVLYSFCNQQNCADGAYPRGNLIDVNGTLYGTTYGGGTTNGGSCGSAGCGTVFSLNLSTGTETVVYSFCEQSNCTDGAFPYAGLIDVNGTLYGTTLGGGNTTGSCGSAGCGTVFSIAPGTGTETVVYAFCNRPNCVDGASPWVSLIEAKGKLYGTTARGGNTDLNCGDGCGTVFEIDPDAGKEMVLHSFCSEQDCMDGADPVAALIEVNGTLYGTTEVGGSYNGGTVFSIVP